MGSIFKNLDWPDGNTNPAGIKSIGYFFAKADIIKYPIYPAAPATPGEVITLNGDFELASSKKMMTIYTTQGLGKVEFDSQGEKDCKTIVNKGSLSYPDISDEAKAFATQALNSNMVFIIPHYVSGGGVRYCVLGSENFDSTVTTKGTSGSKPGDTKGLTIEIEAPDFVALPIYTGLITTEKGTLNCETGVFTPAGQTPSAE